MQRNANLSTYPAGTVGPSPCTTTYVIFPLHCLVGLFLTGVLAHCSTGAGTWPKPCSASRPSAPLALSTLSNQPLTGRIQGNTFVWVTQTDRSRHGVAPMKGKRQHVEARVSTSKVRAKAQRAYIRAHSPRVEPDQYHYFELNAAERVAFSGCVHRPSFIGGAASVVDAFGTLRDCKRPDPSLEGSFEAVCFHFRASGYWIAKSFGRLIDAEERSPDSAFHHHRR